MRTLLALQILLAASAAAQDTMTVRGNCRIGVDDQGPGVFWSLQQAALGDARTIRAVEPNRSQLVQVLRKASIDALDADQASRLGVLDFTDRTLLESLRVDLAARGAAALDSLEIVDALSSRAGLETRSMNLEHRLELTGSTDSVSAAAAFLDRFIAANRARVEISVAIVTEPALPADQPACLEVVALDAAALEARQRELKSGAGGESIASPRLSLFGGQRGNVVVRNQLSYVRDFDVEVERGDVIVDPVVDVVNEGLMIDVTPVLSADGTTLSLDADVSVSNVVRPIRTVELNFERKTPVTLELPEVRQDRWHGDKLVLKEGERGFEVKGLEIEVRDEKTDKLERRRIQVLLAIERVASDAVAVRLGPVMGFDSATGEAFVRVTGKDGSTSKLAGEHIEIIRGNVKVGECEVIELTPGVIVMKLKQGEAKAGDEAVRGH